MSCRRRRPEPSPSSWTHAAWTASSQEACRLSDLHCKLLCMMLLSYPSKHANSFGLRCSPRRHAGLDVASGIGRRLATFMPYAAEQTRQARHEGSNLEVDITRSALRMTRRVSLHVAVCAILTRIHRCRSGRAV